MAHVHRAQHLSTAVSCSQPCVDHAGPQAGPPTPTAAPQSCKPSLRSLRQTARDKIAGPAAVAKRSRVPRGASLGALWWPLAGICGRVGSRAARGRAGLRAAVGAPSTPQRLLQAGRSMGARPGWGESLRSITHGGVASSPATSSTRRRHCRYWYASSTWGRACRHKGAILCRGAYLGGGHLMPG